MLFFKRAPLVPVLRLTGTIGAATPLRAGLTMAGTAGAIERAFALSKTPAVAVVINSPGGSPVQSHLIYKRIRSLANETGKKVYVFAEDVAASGGYLIALAGDEIFADASSIVGSIGVISAGFGFDKAIERLGIERRMYTSGRSKGALDPFQPERAEDIARLRGIQDDVHAGFIALVKERRGARLLGNEEELFSGAFWTGRQGMTLGLVDGIADLKSKMQEMFGKDVKLRVVPLGGGGLMGRLRRLPGIGAGAAGQGQPTLAEDVVSTLEARALWARFGL
ncbi:MAG: S49 family peptidase [Hyphomicrobiaceae bacterium]